MQRMNEDGTSTPVTTFTQIQSSRGLIVFVITVGIVAVIAIAMAAVAVDRSNFSSTGSTQNTKSERITCYGSKGDSRKNAQGKRIYSIAVGHDYGANQYIDSNGYLAGLTKDLIFEVCAAAGIDCRLVWEPYTNCYVSKAGEHPRGGEGLLDSWYDACADYVVTVPRIHIFKFSMSYLKPSLGVFYVRKDDNTFDYKAFNEKKIGFLDGWAYNEKCLQRNTDKTLPTANIKHYLTTKDLKDAIVNRSIDAGMAGIGDMQGYTKEIKKATGPAYQCTVRGNGMMSRKDSDFPELFNVGLSKLMSSGRFRKICKEAKDKHVKDGRGIIECVN